MVRAAPGSRSHEARSADEQGPACGKICGIVLAVPQHPRDQSRIR